MLAVTQKQDKLLYLCAYLLLNLSEDPDIERKMQKKVGMYSISWTPVIDRVTKSHDVFCFTT